MCLKYKYLLLFRCESGTGGESSGEMVSCNFWGDPSQPRWLLSHEINRLMIVKSRPAASRPFLSHPPFLNEAAKPRDSFRQLSVGFFNFQFSIASSKTFLDCEAKPRYQKVSTIPSFQFSRFLYTCSQILFFHL